VLQFLDILTNKVIERQEYLRVTHGLQPHDTFICDDSAAILSADDYRRFLLPYNLRYKEHFGGLCTLHCDGRANHLLPIFADDLRIGCFWSFGYQTDRAVTAAYLGGRAVLVGNINPIIVHTGPVETVFEETLSALQAFAPRGGYIIMDGSNIPPGTPPENINAMADAALAYDKQL
jgi:uroporphyrinogen decarboxylase